MSVTADDIVASARKQLGIWYDWWYEGVPIPQWIYEYPDSCPPRWWFEANGIMCSDLINAARMDNGLTDIGGTPAYYDWMLYHGGVDFVTDDPGVPGALACNPGVWRGGYGQGHIVMYTDDHTLIQATDGAGDFAGVNEGEDDRDTVSWWTPWVYALMPDVDYSKYLGDDAPEPEPALPGPPRWYSLDKNMWIKADGPDWSGGWLESDKEGRPGRYRGASDA